jgi:hypothetical protein
LVEVNKTMNRKCKECGRSEPEIKIKKGRLICGKCVYQKYKHLNNKYFRDRYRNDEEFRQKYRDKRKKYRQTGYDKEYKQRSIRHWLYNKTRRIITHANRSNHERTITLDDLCALWDRSKGKCALTGVQMTTQFGCLFSASIDRIDSNKGYIPENVQLVCKAINLAKNKNTDEEVARWLQAIREVKNLPLGLG